MIFDCGSDVDVKTRVLEEHENLTKSGYDRIIGLRDVRPTFSITDIPRLEMHLRTRIKTSWIPVDILLSIMEIEAWFLAEYTHFPKIDPALTSARIHASLGFDPVTQDMGLRANPSIDLDNSYQLVGRHYRKGDPNGTVSILDYGHMYFGLQGRIPYFERLCKLVDQFLQ
jgi:hypothetical protein